MNTLDISSLRAVVLAAGLSSRMDGTPKALMPLGGTTMLGMAVRAFWEAGIKGVRVVTGHEGNLVAEEAIRLGATPVFNPDYKEGMFSSICAGLDAVAQEREDLLFPPAPVEPIDLAALEEREILEYLTSPGETVAPEHKPAGIDAVLLLPVDAALVRKESISALVRAWASLDLPTRRKAVFIPCFDDWCGHPPLFGSDHFLSMLLWQGNGQWQDQWQWRGGLRDYLSVLLEHDVEMLFCRGRSPERCSCAFPGSAIRLHDCSVSWPREGAPEAAVFFLSLPDAGITSDMDTPQALEEASAFLARTRGRRAPVPEEAWEWLRQSDLSREKKRHCILVALGALRLGLALEKTGSCIDVDLHTCGGLLHDIARMCKGHAHAGAGQLREQGWLDCAAVVGAHTVLPDSALKALGLEIRDIPVGGEAGSARSLEEETFRPEVLHAAVCVYLSDKFFYGDQYVSLAQRFEAVREHVADSAEAMRAVDHRQKIACAVRDRLLALTGQKPEETVLRPGRHDLEKWLLSLLRQYPAEDLP